MPNDTSTLNGSLLEMKDQLISELGAKGVTASYSSSTGLLGLIGEISNIQTGGGGATNIVQGTFTTGSTRNIVETVTLSYNGNGYPIAFIVFVDGGVYGNTTWYNLLSQYDIGHIMMVKQYPTSTPTYNTDSNENYGMTYMMYKSSDTTATSMTNGSSTYIYCYTSVSTTQFGSSCVVFNSATQMKITIGGNANNRRGLTPNTEYAYIVIYSE